LSSFDSSGFRRHELTPFAAKRPDWRNIKSMTEAPNGLVHPNSRFLHVQCGGLRHTQDHERQIRQALANDCCVVVDGAIGAPLLQYDEDGVFTLTSGEDTLLEAIGECKLMNGNVGYLVTANDLSFIFLLLPRFIFYQTWVYTKIF
jgi:hypothetical protein